MSFQITIKPSNHVFSVESGESVLEAALRQSFGLPYGCRNGACGSCKGKILDGEVDYGVYQESALSEAEKRAGMALFCQAKPRSNLVIEAREISAVKDIQIRKLPCRVQKMERPAEDVMVLYLKLPSNERLQFLAGQYIDILMKEGKRRSFSMANPPHDDECLELHVRNIAGGAFTDYVFNKMRERDILRFEGPLGTFFLREDSEKPIIFVASGTGFAPIKSIIEHAFYKNDHRQMILYWGARKLADLYMLQLPIRWQRERDNFKFVPVLSEALPGDRWSGRSGLVHQAVMDDFSDLNGFQLYACGAPVMVEAARRDFIAMRNLSLEEFYSDSFTFSNDPKSS
ncbi:MAG TPA: CDP-6-deoxy-delta-3,4-glucoseen reductase [Burkholderiales bacterium]|nr:CDP-6-deoxy-delta-3,4-glucoseen reductase [Burkholderiales bacterium]